MKPPVDILLTTLNASYSHAAFGVRYLMANLGSLQERAEMPGQRLRLPALDDGQRGKLEALRPALAGQLLQACG